MDTSKDDSDEDILWRLTADQRQQIYNEEKRRRKQSAPMFSKQTKILIVAYLLGCVLIYFGIPQSFIAFCVTGQWTHKPETDIFGSLVNAAVELIRPFLAAVVCAWLFLMFSDFGLGVVTY